MGPTSIIRKGPSLSLANTYTGAQTLTPGSAVTALTINQNIGGEGLRIKAAAISNNSLPSLHLLDDNVTFTSGPHLEVDAYGTGNAVDIHWFPTNPVGTTGGCALGLHGYRDPGAGQGIFIVDNTDAGATVKLKLTEGSNNPNGWGRGLYFDLYGYKSATAHGTSDGSITSGSAVLTSLSGSFAAKDVGKPIRVPGAGAAAGNLDTTILSYQSATQVTLATNASTTVTTANYIYPVVGDVGQVAKITGAPPNFGSITAANRGALRFINTQPGTGNLAASPWSFETSAGQCNCLELLQPGGSATVLLINNVGTGAAIATQLSGTNKWVLDKDGAITRCGSITLTGATADGNLILGTTTGTKIGTATTQKLGFYNATPIVQPSGTPAAATDLASVISVANSLRTSLLALGMVA